MKEEEKNKHEEDPTGLLLEYFTQGARLSALAARELHDRLSQVFNKKQLKRLHNELVVDPFDPDSVRKACSNVLGLDKEKEPDRYQDLANAVSFFFLERKNFRSKATSKPAIQPAEPPKRASQTIPLSGKPDPDGTSTIPPPEQADDGDGITKVRSMSEIEREMNIAEGNKNRESLAVRLDEILTVNEKLSAEIADAEKQADSLKKQRKERETELTNLSNAVGSYSDTIAEERKRYSAIEKELTELSAGCEKLGSDLAHARKKRTVLERELSSCENDVRDLNVKISKREDEAEERRRFAEQMMDEAEAMMSRAREIELEAQEKANAAQERIKQSVMVSSQPVQGIVLYDSEYIKMTPEMTEKFNESLSPAVKFSSALDKLIMLKNFLKDMVDENRKEVIGLQSELEILAEQRASVKAQCEVDIDSHKVEAEKFKAKIAELLQEAAARKADYQDKEKIFRDEIDRADARIDTIAGKAEQIKKRLLEAEDGLKTQQKEAEERLLALDSQLKQTVSEAEQRMRLAIENARDCVEESYHRHFDAVNQVELFEIRESGHLKDLYKAAIIEKRQHADDFVKKIEELDSIKASLETRNKRDKDAAEKSRDAALFKIAKLAEAPRPSNPPVSDGESG